MEFQKWLYKSRNCKTWRLKARKYKICLRKFKGYYKWWQKNNRTKSKFKSQVCKKRKWPIKKCLEQFEWYNYKKNTCKNYKRPGYGQKMCSWKYHYSKYQWTCKQKRWYGGVCKYRFEYSRYWKKNCSERKKGKKVVRKQIKNDACWKKYRSYAYYTNNCK